MNRFFHQSNPGFSLIELLVAISIFAILSTVVVVNLRGGPSQEVQLQANNLTSLLRQTQVQSLSGEQFNGSVATGGYGVKIATCSTPPCIVTVFADVNGNFSYDGVSEDVQTVSLGQDVTIDSLSLSSPVHVIFKPPRPFVCFDNVCSGSGVLTITLGSASSSKTETVTVNQISGQISST